MQDFLTLVSKAFMRGRWRNDLPFELSYWDMSMITYDSVSLKKEAEIADLLCKS